MISEIEYKRIARHIMNAAFEVHKELRLGLIQSIHEVQLASSR